MAKSAIAEIAATLDEVIVVLETAPASHDPIPQLHYATEGACGLASWLMKVGNRAGTAWARYSKNSARPAVQNEFTEASRHV